MVPLVLAAGIGAFAGLAGSWAESRAAKKNLDKLMDFIGTQYGPQFALQKKGISMVESELLPRVGKPSLPLLGQHIVNQSRLQRAGAASENAITNYFRTRGNAGRALGAQWQAKLAGAEALNQEGVGYVGAQEQYRQQTAGQALDAIMNLTSGANNAMAALTGAQAQKGEATTGFYNALGGAMGNVTSAWEWDILNKSSKSGGLPASTLSWPKYKSVPGLGY